MRTPVGVLLAAGLGTRYDPTGESLKLLQPAAGESHADVAIVATAARNLRSSVKRMLAVVRPRHHPHQAILHDLLQNEGCELVVCERAAEAMGTSPACGIAASGDADAWIAALGDMPAIDPDTIDAIADALRAGHRTAAPMYREQRGHPVGFSAACLSALINSSGDLGARSVLEEFPPHLIAVDDAGVLLDIDHRWAQSDCVHSR